MADFRNIVILTGAGISAESGVPTFRGPDGLWESRRVEDVAPPEAYAHDPDLVLDFYDQRRARLDTVEPNPAHHALGRLDAEWDGELLIVTQNVDDLHERGGAKRRLHMHGELKSGWCLACDASGHVCPDIVWFGETPYEMDRIEAILSTCDLFVSIGTSGAVHPAAGFVRTARHFGAQTLEVNLDPREGSIFFHVSRMGKAGDLVPEWLDGLLSR